jgi:hypothetical protein
MTIAQGIAHNKIRKLARRRDELLRAFDRLAADHRDTSGIYRRGANWNADFYLAKIESIDAEISAIKLS